MEYGSDSAAQAGYVSNAPYSAPNGGAKTVNGTKTVHTFTTSGTFIIPDGISGDIEILVVGGGGAGGTWCGGGGGGGGVVHETAHSISAGSFSVVVGNGGTKPTANGTGANGGNSTFDGITAYGGGGGGAYPTENGSNGGSGGGVAHGTTGTPGTGISGQGYAGGDGNNLDCSGGGGGAGNTGYTATTSSRIGGAGGDGYQSSISGTATYYGGGGGGWGFSASPAAGGQGGGGSASRGDDGGTVQAVNGTANTGGGGGGGWYQPFGYLGGAGGSGVVIISYVTDDFDLTSIPLLDYSEPTTITEGSYSLKAIAAQTTALNKTLTRTITTPINLISHAYIIGKIRASRTGSNIKIGFHDSGGTTTEITPNIVTADTWQTIQLDISAVSDANKDAIDQIIITVANADADNTFYLDNFFAVTAADYALGVQASKVVAYAVLSVPEALNVSKAVAYAVLGPYVEPESGSGPMMWIF
jgi:hypothetical protein